MIIANKKPKVKKRKARKPTLDSVKALTAYALGATKSQAAVIAGSKAKTASAQCQSFNKIMGREEKKEIMAKMLKRGVDLYDLADKAAQEMLKDETLSAKEKVGAFSPLSAAKTLEALHKIDRLENDQSTENIGIQYADYSPQQLKEMLLKISKEQGLI